MLYTKDLGQLIFDNFTADVDEFIVISGWLGAVQIEQVAKKGVKVTALYGMSANAGVPGPNHQKLKMMDNTNRNLSVFYALPGNEVHSKIYVWKSRGVIKKALMGSANFTYQGLNTPERESLISVNESDFPSLETYINSILQNGKIERCSSTTLKTRISSIARIVVLDPNKIIIDGVMGNVKTIRLTLLDRNGNVPDASGINWGHGESHTTPNDAYIKISVAAVKTGFFSPKSYARIPGAELERVKKVRMPMEVIWDDGEAMDCLEEGNQEVEEILYPKQIASAYTKDILGLYLRKRLGLAEGTKVTMEDLRRYGRTHIDVTITGPNSYYMDFSKLS